MEKITPRAYQQIAIDKCVLHFKEKCKTHGVAVLPTGAGKSVVIAMIADQINEPLLVLQPTKEILEQNIGKYRAIGGVASIYSAIIGEKIISQVTFATIGSIVNNARLFKQFKCVLIDECHVVNSKQGMYDFFLNSIPDLCCIGLTATPYRLKTQGNAAVIEFITRIRPAFFKQIIHVTQQQEIKAQGFLSEIIYKKMHEINTENVLVKNGEYEDVSLLQECRRVKIEDLIIQEIEEAQKTRKHILVFVPFIETLEKIKAKLPQVQYVTGMTAKIERETILADFKKGKISILLNVGVLTTGFDFPSLDCIIIAKPTRSLSLWYQIIGRGQRISAGKENCLVVDMCNTIQLLGDVQQLEVVEQNGKWIVKQGFRTITNKAF